MAQKLDFWVSNNFSVFLQSRNIILLIFAARVQRLTTSLQGFGVFWSCLLLLESCVAVSPGL